MLIFERRKLDAHMRRFLMIAYLLLSLLPVVNAQDAYKAGGSFEKKKVYLSTGINGHILSSSLFKDGQTSNGYRFTTARFTSFLHLGTVANFDFNPYLGIFSGLNIKNIGFIERLSVVDSTVIHRAYTFGIPLGIKIGDLDFGNYAILGGGVDFPFNYKEKGFVKRGKKDKFNEWFGTRVPAVLPYLFVGAHLRPGVTLKVQYYPTNFLNEDFSELVDDMVVQPYKDYEVKLCLMTLGIDINYRPKRRIDSNFAAASN